MIGEKFAVLAIDRNIFFPFRVEEAARHPGRCASVIGIVTLVGGEKSVGAKVPLADGRGGVASGPKCFGNRRFLMRKLLIEWGRNHLGKGQTVAAWDEVGELQARRVLSGLNTGASRRADRAGSVGVAERHGARGEAVDVGRVVEARTLVDVYIRPAEVIH